MPEPNLPPLFLKTDFFNEHNINASSNLDYAKWYKPDKNSDLIDVSILKASLPELPNETRSRLVNEFNLTNELAVTLVVRKYKFIFNLLVII